MSTLKPRASALALVFAIFFAGIGTGLAMAAQSRMVNARTYLRDALNELEAAQENKGGHRANAINFVRQAIDEVNLGIQYANGS
ncbi:MAG TPA: hypothetical protein VK755_11895 [Candidatus Acidoferrales bacterium]|jgi:hypothetical protein|nr:hypothetical protein [Candidatus Acidoferrales bacterium]